MIKIKNVIIKKTQSQTRNYEFNINFQKIHI